MRLEKLFAEYPVIEATEVILKSIEESNINDLHAIYNNKRVFELCGILPKHNKNTVSNMINHFRRDYKKKSRVKFGIFIKADVEIMVGIIEIMDTKKKIDMVSIGYYLAEEHWGLGYASKALRALLDYLFCEIEVNRVHAEVMIENEASKRVLLKNGFMKEGRIRQASFWPGKGIVDLDVFGILKEDYYE